MLAREYRSVGLALVAWCRYSADIEKAEPFESASSHR